MTEEEIEEKEMPFWEHVAELIRRLRVIVIALLISITIFTVLPANVNDFWAMLISFRYKPLVSVVLDRIKQDILPKGVILIGGSIEEPITLYFEVSAVLSFIVTSPIIAYEIYEFIAPGLYAHEKKFLKRFVIGFSILFTAGVIYAYYLLLPITFRILIIFTEFVGAQTIFTIRNFYDTVFLGLISSGFFFTIPIFIILAIKFGVFEVDALIRYKRYLYVAVFTITAIITPDPTPVSMLILSIPFVILYEISIFIGKRVAPKD